MRVQVRKAFTLVEILIVVVILGILAAIVVPQFTNATQDAQAGNLAAQLDTLNNQLELYRARNNSQVPLDLDTAAVVSSTTVLTGMGAWETMVTEGYLKKPPRNPACPEGAAASFQQFQVNLDGAAANVGWSFEDGPDPAPPVGVDGRDSITAAYYDENTNTITITP